jgi:gamma-glutamyltranspeptidase/glutathione hydrolase
MRLLAVLLALCVAASAPIAAAKPHHAQPAAQGAPQGRMLVAAANPLAAEAGMEVLRRGGTAADAAVAIQTVLGLVEPQSSGVGGGSFMTYYDARTGKVTAYNGREKAPGGATPDMFLGTDGKPLSFGKAVVSGRATGVPGAFALLALAQKEHGKLAWSSLFRSAEGLADHGFKVTPRLVRMLYAHAAENSRPDVIAYGLNPSGQPYKVGDLLRNKAYAAMMRRLAAKGPNAIYEGEVADAIVAKTHEEPLAGTMTLADLKAYQAKESPALCRPYRLYIVCVPPPPSSGVNLLQALLILEHTDIDKRGPNDPKAWLEIAEAERLMYADRDRYVGDPAFVSVPVEGMLDPAYIAGRAALIGERAGAPPPAGTPPGAVAMAADHTVEPGGTSHFVVVDRWGNSVSMTTTVESLFGTGRMVHGFFLNNQLTDFSFAPRDPAGRPMANAVAGGKRPRSSMAPIIVLDRKGRFVAALGSPGGTAILAYNLKAVVGVLDWHLTMQQAVSLPNLVAKGTTFAGEEDKFSPETLAGLRALGADVRTGQGEESGLHGVILRNGKLDGGADPRREGVVLTH